MEMTDSLARTDFPVLPASKEHRAPQAHRELQATQARTEPLERRDQTEMTAHPERQEPLDLLEPQGRPVQGVETVLPVLRALRELPALLDPLDPPEHPAPLELPGQLELPASLAYPVITPVDKPIRLRIIFFSLIPCWLCFVLHRRYLYLVYIRTICYA